MTHFLQNVTFTIVFFIEIFFVEKIHLHAVAKNNTEKPFVHFAQFSPMVMFSKIII